VDRSRKLVGPYMFGFVCLSSSCRTDLRLTQSVDCGWLQYSSCNFYAISDVQFLFSRIGNPCHDEVLNPVERIAPVSTGGGGVRAVFIAVGYRVSVLGFLAGKVLDSEENKGGNYGMWDQVSFAFSRCRILWISLMVRQRCALEWVHKNIHYFGGNHRLITLGGQSTGAYSAHAQLFHKLLRAPKTEGGLFHNVVLWVDCNFIFYSNMFLTFSGTPMPMVSNQSSLKRSRSNINRSSLPVESLQRSHQLPSFLNSARSPPQPSSAR